MLVQGAESKLLLDKCNIGGKMKLMEIHLYLPLSKKLGMFFYLYGLGRPERYKVIPFKFPLRRFYTALYLFCTTQVCVDQSNLRTNLLLKIDLASRKL